MNWDISTRGLELAKLQRMHAGMQLRDEHFISFRQNLLNTLRELKVKDKQLYLVSQRMNGFKPYILNRESLASLAQKHGAGKQYFTEKYVKSLLGDPRTQTLVAMKGR